MKHFKMLFLVITIALVFMTGKEAAGQENNCPDGNPPQVIQLTVNGCLFNVRICYECSPLGLTNTWLTIFGFSKVSSVCQLVPPLSPSGILQNIANQLNTFYWLDRLCPNQIGPCNEPVDSYFQLAEPICWHKRNINGDIHYLGYCPVPADHSYCLTIWKWCYNTQTGLPERTLYFGPFISSNNVEPICTSPEPADPPPGETSTCFYLQTLCPFP